MASCNRDAMTVLMGTDAGDRLIGGAESDSVMGFGGDDDLRGHDGVDTLRGGGGDDKLESGYEGGPSHDLLSGGSGDDLILARAGARISGGAGFDTLQLDLTFVRELADVDLRALDDGGRCVLPGGTVLAGVEAGFIAFGGTSDRVRAPDTLAISLLGWIGDDTLIGGLGADTLVGGDHSDLLSGRDGADVLIGGSLDRLYGGGGDDLLRAAMGDAVAGSGGIDRVAISFASTRRPVHIDLEALHLGEMKLPGETFLKGVEGGDFDLTGYDDVVLGGRGDLSARGLAGNDQLIGGRGADTLDGGLGADVVAGGRGRDRLDFGLGDDTLSGGKGADVFAANTYYFGDRDTITVIRDLGAEDAIDFSAFRSRPWGPVRPVSEFTGGPGEMVIQYDAASDKTLILIEWSYDLDPDFTVAVNGDHRDFSNFVL